MDGAGDVAPDVVSRRPADGGDVPNPGGGTQDPPDEDFKFAPALNEFIAAGQGELLMDVFTRTLERPVHEQTWDDLLRAVDLLVEGFGFGLLREMIWAARVRPERVRADFDNEGISAEAQALLTQVLVRYGAALRKAYALSPLSSFPDDWEIINPEVLMNVTDNELEISTFIRKKNGESLVVRSGGSGFLRWLAIMHGALTEAGDLKRFRKSDVERLLEELDASRAMLTGDLEDQTTEASE